jgi:hypothetical protein
LVFNPESSRRASTVSFTKLPSELALVVEVPAPSRRSSVRSQSRARAEKSSIVRFHRALSVVVMTASRAALSVHLCRRRPTIAPRVPTEGGTIIRLCEFIFIFIRLCEYEYTHPSIHPSLPLCVRYPRSA